jgi:hypothetical protein
MYVKGPSNFLVVLFSMLPPLSSLGATQRLLGEIFSLLPEFNVDGAASTTTFSCHFAQRRFKVRCARRAIVFWEESRSGVDAITSSFCGDKRSLRLSFSCSSRPRE